MSLFCLNCVLGLLNPGSTFVFTFPVAGSFTVWDLLHVGTQATIVVAAQAPPLTPAAVQLAASSALTASLSALPAIASSPSLVSPVAKSLTVPGQTRPQWTVQLGLGFQSNRASFVGPLPAAATIAPGDSVSFVNADITAHIVAFNPGRRVSWGLLFRFLCVWCSDILPRKGVRYHFILPYHMLCFGGYVFSLTSFVLLPQKTFPSATPIPPLRRSSIARLAPPPTPGM
jgi:plastocyanin